MAAQVLKSRTIRRAAEQVRSKSASLALGQVLVSNATMGAPSVMGYFGERPRPLSDIDYSLAIVYMSVENSGSIVDGRKEERLHRGIGCRGRALEPLNARIAIGCFSQSASKFTITD